jgi:hypothetical protein
MGEERALLHEETQETSQKVEASLKKVKTRAGGIAMIL